MSPLSLELDIAREPGGSYAARAMVMSVDPPQRVPIVPGPVPLTLDPVTLRSLLGLEQYGETLTEMVFRPPLVRAFGYAQGYQQRGGEPISLRIVLDPADNELHSIRWELLREPPNGFPLATSEEIVFARTLFAKKVTGHTLSQPGGGVVIAVADPPAMPLPQIPGLDYVELARKGLGQTRQVMLDGRENRNRATLSALDQALATSPEVLYLLCHGAMVKGQPYI